MLKEDIISLLAKSKRENKAALIKIARASEEAFNNEYLDIYLVGHEYYYVNDTLTPMTRGGVNDVNDDFIEIVEAKYDISRWGVSIAKHTYNVPLEMVYCIEIFKQTNNEVGIYYDFIDNEKIIIEEWDTLFAYYHQFNGKEFEVTKSEYIVK